MATKSERRKARALIDLEYGPQYAQVRDLWNQTRSSYLNDLSKARQIETGIKVSAAAAEPRIRDIYHDARDDLKSSSGFVDRSIAALPAAPQTGLTALLGQQMQRERGTALNRNTGARAQALTELTNRASSAEAGKALAYRAAKSNLTSQRKDLTTRLADLTGQSGAKMTALLEGMVGDRHDANVKARTEADKATAQGNKTLTSGPYRGHKQADVDAATPEQLRAWERQNTKTSSSAKGGGRASLENREQISNDFAEAWGTAKTFDVSTPAKRHAAAAEIIKGSAPVKDKKGNVTPGVKKAKQFVASMALDMEADGHISRANAKKLHDLGYKLSDLTGAVSYGTWLKSPAGRRWLAQQRNPKQPPAPKPPVNNVFTRSPFG
jgi:hypothetical protein